MLQIVDDALAIQEVHGCGQPVPVETLGRAQVAGLARQVGNGNDLLERDNLNSCDDGQHVNMTHKEGGEKTTNHDEGPESACDEVGLLLLVLGLGVLDSGGLRELGPVSDCSYILSLSIPTSSRLSIASARDEPSSLASLKLPRRASDWPLCLCGNLTPRRSLPVMVLLNSLDVYSGKSIDAICLARVSEKQELW